MEDIINNYVTKTTEPPTASSLNKIDKSLRKPGGLVPYWCAEVEFNHPERWGFDVIIRDKLDWLTEDLKETKELQFSTQIGPVPDFKVIKIYKEGNKDKSHRWDGLVKQINGGV